jgi:hypothetical protein
MTTDMFHMSWAIPGPFFILNVATYKLKFHNGKIEIISFVVRFRSKLPLTVNFEVEIKVWTRPICICDILYFKLNGIYVINEITKPGVYISQLIRYSRACGSYQDFIDRGLMLTRKLLKQGFLLVKRKSSLRKFYGRHHDLPLFQTQWDICDQRNHQT